MTRYTILRPSEETECEQCGCPLYVGDKATEDRDRAFCSKNCARLNSDEEVTVPASMLAEAQP